MPLAGPRPISHIARLRLAPRRALSTTPRRLQEAASPPPSKICAVPFHFGPQAAESRLKIAALLASATVPNLFYATLLRFFGESLTPFLKEFGLGGNTITHKATRAVLYPIWRFNLVAEGKVRAPDMDNISGKAWVGIKEGSLPGNAFSPLSLLSFSQQDLPSSLPTYDPSQDLTQLGAMSEITPIPFTVSPFKVLDQVKGEMGRKVRWQGLETDAVRDWKEVMLAAYPIYFPLYIGEYSYKKDDKSKARSITIVMDAHLEKVDDCRLAVPRPTSQQMRGVPQTYYINNPSFISDCTVLLNPQELHMAAAPSKPSTSSPTSFIQMTSLNASSLSESLALRFADWLNPPAEESTATEGTPVLMPPMSPLARVDEGELTDEDWSDKRVRMWDGGEREENEEWLDAGKLKMYMKVQMDGIEQAGSSGNTTTFMTVKVSSKSLLPSVEKQPLEEVLFEARKEYDKACKEYEEKKPVWVKEMETKKGE